MVDKQKAKQESPHGGEKKQKTLSTEEMLAELKNVPIAQMTGALKMYLADEEVSAKKLH